MLPDGLPDSKVIEDIVLYHIALGRYPSTTLTSGDIEMLNGDSVSVVVSDNAGGVTVNGENVIGPDNYVLDGVVHIIDAVLIPPSIDLGTTTASSGSKEEV
jgi:transforming growth factor-beta-induced protein